MILAANLQHVRQRMEAAALRSGRQVQDIQLLAVSKTVDVDVVQTAYDLGLRDFGENRVPELKRKQKVFSDANWHMIGRIQTNKVKEVVEHASLIHSLDRWHLAEEIDKRAAQTGRIMPCLLQVNIAGEEQKAGIHAQETRGFLEAAQALSHLKICGLMTMAPDVEDLEMTRPVFRGLRELAEQLKQYPFRNAQMRYLSMGMSHDFEIAIEEGANIIRVGSALFA